MVTDQLEVRTSILRSFIRLDLIYEKMCKKISGMPQVPVNFLLLFLSYGYCLVADLTLVNEQALVRSGEISYLKCVSETDLRHEAFARVLATGSGSRIPAMSLVGPISPESWPGKRLSLFPEDQSRRHGVYSCEVTDPETNTITKVIAAKMGTSGDVWPQYPTYTTSVEAKNFNISFKSFDTNVDVLWRHNNNPMRFQPRDSLSRSITTVTPTDAGIYECYKADEATATAEHRQTNQAFIRVIVRGCPSQKWRPPDCNQLCFCINGAACDHLTGKCICPPGFHGVHCEKGCGGNRFGASCQHHCKDGGTNYGADADACYGKHFCLPDPYGCSCATGFSGVECRQNCLGGRFGADCKLECHCKADERCDPYSGACAMGCAAGWKGETCQIPCEHSEWGENCGHQCNCYNNEQCDARDGSCPGGRCAEPFSGSSCQIDSLDECSSNPCKHGGECVDKVFAYECDCVEGTGGRNCEIDYDDCETNPCENNAICEDKGPNEYICHCLGGYRGKNCETNIDDCQQHKCTNNASCVDDVMTYSCKCELGFTGRFCENGESSEQFGSILILAVSVLGMILMLVALVGCWYWWQNKKNRLQHIGPGRSAW